MRKLYQLLLLLAIASAPALAQCSVSTILGTDIVSASRTTINNNFSSLNTCKPQRFSGAGVPGDVPSSVLGDVYFNTSAQGSIYGCYKTHCTAVGTGNWVLLTGDSATTAVTLTANLPVIGAGGSAVAVGTRSGNTTEYVTTTGSLTNGNCVKIDASGNFIANGSACSTGNVTTGTTLTANLPVFGNGGVDTIVGTRSGNTTDVVTTTGAQTSGDCVKIDASGNHIANGAACATGNVTTGTTLTANLPVFGNGGVDTIVGTRSGNTTAVVTTTGAQTSGDCVKIDASGNHVANGSSCGATIGQGTFAALPGTCVVGDLYFFTDSLYPNARCSSTNTWSYFFDGKIFGLPSSTFNAWDNQSTATLTTTNGYSVMAIPASHTGGLAYRYVSITPLSTFDHVFAFRVPIIAFGGTNRMAVVSLKDASKCILFGTYATGNGLTGITITTYTDTICTTGGSNPTADVNYQQLGNNLYLRVVQDSTNLTLYYGSDGNTWTQHYQGSRTAIFGSGATTLGWGGVPATNGQIIQLVGYN